jgi:hypothetical protein
MTRTRSITFLASATALMAAGACGRRLWQRQRRERVDGAAEDGERAADDGRGYER